MGRVKNRRYRQFLDQGVIELLNEEQIQEVLDEGVDGQHIKEGRALVIALYYTGARPREILDMKAGWITKKQTHVILQIPGAKRGLPRQIHLQFKRPMVRELWNFARKIMPEMYLFYNYRSHYVRMVRTKEGMKQQIDITDSLRYHITKWFQKVIPGGITPYFLRHNRWSKLARAGVSLQDIRMLKGAKSYESVMPYLHLSTETASRMARKID